MDKIVLDESKEQAILRSIKELVDVKNQNLLGWNEDAVAVPVEEGYIVLNSDTWVASTDRPDGLSFFNCGYRALINSASDIIAKGVNPKYAVISLSIPKVDVNNVKEVLKGVAFACNKYNISYLGGDLNSANDLVIDVTTWGYSNDKLIRRDGAKVGEFIYWIGPSMGMMSSALGILTNNWRGDSSKAIKIYGIPKLYVDFLQYDASSAIDCSDGVASSLYHLSIMSDVGFEINLINVNKWTEEIADINGIDIMDLIFYGGEELGILFTSHLVYEESKDLILLGKVVERKEVRYLNKIIDNKGWQHFNS
ncbi:MAG: Thiamine-monophosphate kinase [Candidatus Heimdallarchaeota archaeon LC_2]|nr:MAG: Thiamine-monophosphate kinase [Candidatus Heimdallarchaeota archaeon LC_2]